MTCFQSILQIILMVSNGIYVRGSRWLFQQGDVSRILLKAGDWQRDLDKNSYPFVIFLSGKHKNMKAIVQITFHIFRRKEDVLYGYKTSQKQIRQSLNCHKQIRFYPGVFNQWFHQSGGIFFAYHQCGAIRIDIHC